MMPLAAAHSPATTGRHEARGGAENQTDVGTMSLVREDGGWKIDAVTSGLFHLF